MKKLHLPKFNLKATFKSRTFRVGGYSVAATGIITAIAIAVNAVVGALPTSMTQFDTTANDLFTISEQTKEILGDVEEDITLYWIVQSGEEDSTLETLLDHYASMSSHISIKKTDPDLYPNLSSEYGISSVSNNSLIVEQGSRSRYVDYNDIYEYDYSNYYYDGSYSVSFAGENELTSAISYVINDTLPKIYTLTGHGESTLSSSFQTAVEKQNMELEELSLLTVTEVPSDADCIFMYAPQSDISADEKDLLLTYLQGGGNFFLITDPQSESDSRPNLDALMETYGMSETEGIILENSSSNYAMSMPYYLLPDRESHTITSPLLENNYYVLLPVAHGITVSDDLDENISVSTLLTTSDDAFSKVSGYNLSTYEKEEGDIDGPFALACAATDAIDDDTTAHIVWISSATIVDDSVNAQVSGGNQDFFLNALGWMCEHEDSISIHSKSLDYEYLTIDSGTASTLSVIIIGVIPVLYLCTGIFIWIRRKRR